MSPSRAPRDAWLKIFALIAALSGGLWALGHRAEFSPEPTSTSAPPVTPAPAHPGRRRPRNGSEWIVDPGGSPEADTETLSAAVADASAGDVIRLRSGLYHDSVVIDKVLKILGGGTKNGTVLVATEKFALSIRSAAVTIEDLTLSAGAGPAVEILDRGWLELKRSAATGSDEGIVLVKRRGSLLTDASDFTASKQGKIIVAEGRVVLKGGILRGGKTQIDLNGEDASLEASGVAFEHAETAVATAGRAKATLTGCRYEKIDIPRREGP